MEALRALIEEWLGENGTQADLARASGVPQNVIGKWRSRQVDEASPTNLKKIAPTLGLTYEQLLRQMGELPAESADADDDDIEQVIRQVIRQRTAEMREAVEGTPQSMWATIIRSQLNRALDGVRDMAHLLTEANAAPSADNVPAPSADNAPRPTSKGGRSGSGPTLRARELVPA